MTAATAGYISNNDLNAEYDNGYTSYSASYNNNNNNNNGSYCSHGDGNA